MPVTVPCDDPHTQLASDLGIDRDVAKRINTLFQFKPVSLVRDRGTAFNLLRCYHVAKIFPAPWGAAKASRWGWLVQDQPFDDRVALNVIKKFLPDGRDMFEHHPLFRPLNIGHRLTCVRDCIKQAEDGRHMEEVELTLRPVAYILEKEGHTIWQ